MDLTYLLFGCLVVACTWYYLHLRNNNADFDTPICAYFERRGDAGKYVTSTHLVAYLRIWDSNIGFA